MLMKFYRNFTDQCRNIFHSFKSFSMYPRTHPNFRNVFSLFQNDSIFLFFFTRRGLKSNLVCPSFLSFIFNAPTDYPNSLRIAEKIKQIAKNPAKIRIWCQYFFVPNEKINPLLTGFRGTWRCSACCRRAWTRWRRAAAPPRTSQPPTATSRFLLWKYLTSPQVPLFVNMQWKWKIFR